MTRYLALTLASFALFSGPVSATETTRINSEITEADVLAAQQAWGNALVTIAKDYEEGGIDKARATAASVIDQAYGYEIGAVLFKPTLAPIPQNIRTTREGALSYFVGYDETYPHDTGFALKGWREVKIENAAIYINGDVALTMGNVHMTNAEGDVTTVDKSWGYQRDEDGNLRIMLHHSSLPYTKP